MKHVEAELEEALELSVGEEISLTGPRQAVLPEHLMVNPVLELPDGLELVGESQDPDEDGTFNYTVRLRASRPLEGELTIGFEDMQTGESAAMRTLAVRAR